MQRWHFYNCKNAPKIVKIINSFDCDGVITIGIYPGIDDVIITGRSFEEKEETLSYLKDKDINNEVYFNKLKFEEKTRISSGIHKGNTIVDKVGYESISNSYVYHIDGSNPRIIRCSNRNLSIDDILRREFVA